MSIMNTATFNSPLEAGIRTMNILFHAYPKSLDLQRILIFDHLVVHTEDIGGPKSLHPELPMRSAEILVRRDLIERGILLMMSRDLIERIVEENGFFYRAGEMAETFLNSLASPYLKELYEKSHWIVERFGNMNDEELKLTTRKFFTQWIEEFQISHKSLGAE